MRFTSQIVDRLLNPQHACDVVLEASLLIKRIGGEEVQETCQLASALRVLVDAERIVASGSLSRLPLCD